MKFAQRNSTNDQRSTSLQKNMSNSKYSSSRQNRSSSLSNIPDKFIYPQSAEKFLPYEKVELGNKQDIPNQHQKHHKTPADSPYLQFKQSSLLHEFRLIHKIVESLKIDLVSCLEYLGGEINYRKIDETKTLIRCFMLGSVPENWQKMVQYYNFPCAEEGIEQFVATLVRKFDHLKYKAVCLENIVEPIVSLERLVDPACWMMNALIFNCLKFNVGYEFFTLMIQKSVLNSCLMVRSCEQRVEKTYQDSLLLKLRGLQLVGGTFDLITGILSDEGDREFAQDLGSLQMEFTTFERDHKLFLVWIF